jgi:nitrilase
MKQYLQVGLVQMAPVLLDKQGTMEKMLHFIEKAGKNECRLVVFSEALLPGYPFWIEHTDGARFESDLQKEFYQRYYNNAVDIDNGDLQPFCDKAIEYNMAMYIGCIEKPKERGRSLYCSLVYISEFGKVVSVHRKLVPTYEERLFWSPGDGHGLQVHALDDFRVGGLNCWENWMVGARMALYSRGEDVHISVWPGNVHNVEQLVPFVGKELRGYSIGVCGIFRREDIPPEIPAAEKLKAVIDSLALGGTCVAGPDGNWVLPPQENEELFTVQLDQNHIVRERHNFDPAGHYSRPDVVRINVNRERQSSVEPFST